MKQLNQVGRAYAWLLLGLGMVVAWPVDAAYVIHADGRRIEGQSIRARANGDVILTTVRGDVTFTRGQYREAWADRPPELDQARRAIEAEQYDEVIRRMEDVVREYRHLSWDIEALALIAQAQLLKGDHQAAIDTYQRLFQAAPNRREDSNIQWGYREALLGAGEFDRLEGILDEVIADGSREDAARAQVMRGDLKRQRGASEAALLDYLRTVVLFKAVQEVQAEATFKAGEALEEMRDQRASDMFRKVVQDYGNSPYAEPARQKL